jgi:hypothetical protein
MKTLSSDYQALDQTTDDLDAGVQDTLALEQVAKVILSASETTLSSPGADLATLAVEALSARLGLSIPVYTSSLEALGSPTVSETAGRVALEGLWEGIATAWEAIRRVVSNLWDRLTTFLLNLFDANARLQKRAQELKAAVDALPFNQPSSLALTLPEVFQGFALKGHLSYGEVDETLRSQLRGTHRIVDHMTGMAIDVIGEIHDFIQQVLLDQTDGTTSDALVQTINQRLSKVFTDGTSLTTPQGQVKRFGPYVYGKAFDLTLNTPAAKVAQVAEVTVVDTSQLEVTEAPVLTRAEMGKVCEAVYKLAQATETLKQEARKLKKLKGAVDQNIASVVDIVKARSQPTLTRVVQRDLTIVRGSLMTIYTAALKVMRFIPHYNVVAGDLALKYVHGSLKAFH